MPTLNEIRSMILTQIASNQSGGLTALQLRTVLLAILLASYDDLEYSSGANPPASPSEGDLWWDTGADELKVWDGAAWTPLAGVVSLTDEQIGAKAWTHPPGNMTALQKAAARLAIAALTAADFQDHTDDFYTTTPQVGTVAQFAEDPNKEIFFTNADGSTPFSPANQTSAAQIAYWTAIANAGAGRIYIGDVQGDHLNFDFPQGQKAATSFADNDVLIIHPQGGAVNAKVAITLSSGPTAVPGQNGASGYKWYSFDAVTLTGEISQSIYRLTRTTKARVQVNLGDIVPGVFPRPYDDGHTYAVGDWLGYDLTNQRWQVLPGGLLVRKTDLVGHENDLFASYQAAAVLLAAGTTDRAGSWCLATNTSGAPTASDTQDADDITDGTATFVIGRPRSDSDPNAAFTPVALDASDYPLGKVMHVSPWNPYDPNNHLKITLTTAGEIVGAGNAEYLWATASVDEVGDIQNTGDYFRISDIKPSGLDLDIPWEAISGPPWLLLSAANAATFAGNPGYLLAVQGGAVKRYSFNDARRHLLGPKNHVALGTFAVSSNIPSVGGRVYVGAESGFLRQVNITWDTDDEENDLTAYLIVGQELQIGSLSGEITGSTPTKNTVANGGFQFSIGELKGTVPTGNVAVTAKGQEVATRVARLTSNVGNVSNAYSGSSEPGLLAYDDGTELLFKPNVANTGAATLNVNGLGNKDVVNAAGAALSSGDLAAGRRYLLVYDDGKWFKLT